MTVSLPVSQGQVSHLQERGKLSKSGALFFPCGLGAVLEVGLDRGDGVEGLDVVLPVPVRGVQRVLAPAPGLMVLRESQSNHILE